MSGADSAAEQWMERRFGANRRKTRVAAITHFDGGSAPAVIRDVSQSGMKLQTDVMFTVGTAIEVDVLDVRVPAIVHWSKEGYCAVRLGVLLDRQTLVALETADDDLSDFR